MFPVFLELDGRDVLVVGGGAVAESKTKSLLEAGARVTVVAPSIGFAWTDPNVMAETGLHTETVLAVTRPRASPGVDHATWARAKLGPQLGLDGSGLK